VPPEVPAQLAEPNDLADGPTVAVVRCSSSPAGSQVLCGRAEATLQAGPDGAESTARSLGAGAFRSARRGLNNRRFAAFVMASSVSPHPAGEAAPAV
jgi:hypothetical protein